jgi:hypothetical protein
MRRGSQSRSWARACRERVDERLDAVRELFTASPYSFELHEPDLLVIGHRRIRGEEEVRGDYLYFVHSCRDGCVCRIAAHTTKEAALAEIDERSR